MSGRLVGEVLDHGPADLTVSERLVLVVLAELARDETRECWPGMDLICRRTGLAARSVRAVFARLQQRGIELRVRIGTGSDGRPTYAVTDQHRTLYRIPRFDARHDTATAETGCAPRHGIAASAAIRRHSAVVEAERPCPGGGNRTPPFPSQTLMGPSPVAPSQADGTTQARWSTEDLARQDLIREGLTPALARLVVELAANDPDTRFLRGRLATPYRAEVIAKAEALQREEQQGLAAEHARSDLDRFVADQRDAAEAMERVRRALGADASPRRLLMMAKLELAELRAERTGLEADRRED